MSDAKKVILFIVEGPTEETAFGSLLEQVFASSAVKFDVFHGDITSKSTADNPRDMVRKEVLKHLERDRGYNWSDLGRIVQLCDTDGAFIPDNCVIKGANENICYEADCIKTCNPEDAISRLRRKRNTMKKLATVDHLTYKKSVVPFEIFYMSRNMEHALHNEAGMLDDDEKVKLAHKFRRRFSSDVDGFCSYLSSEQIAAPGDYAETWQHLSSGCNSLKRCSNLHLVLPR